MNNSIMDPIENTKHFIDSNRNIGQLVNIQVDINRAVWAANVTDLSRSNFKTIEERDTYIANCVNSAFKQIEKLQPSKTPTS